MTMKSVVLLSAVHSVVAFTSPFVGGGNHFGLRSQGASTLVDWGRPMSGGNGASGIECLDVGLCRDVIGGSWNGFEMGVGTENSGISPSKDLSDSRMG